MRAKLSGKNLLSYNGSYNTSHKRTLPVHF